MNRRHFTKAMLALGAAPALTTSRAAAQNPASATEESHLEPARKLPVRRFDVVVAGAGTAGVVAALAAARTGAKTILIERKGYPGGTVVEGGTALHSYFNLWKAFPGVTKKQVVKGIPQEIVDRLAKIGSTLASAPMKAIQTTLLLALGISLPAFAPAAPVHLVDQKPAQIRRLSPDVILVDFDRVAFGNVRLVPPAIATNTITVHFGEALKDGRIDRKPPGTVRYHSARLALSGAEPVVAAPSPDKRNTEAQTDKHPPAVLTPPEWGVVLPFRWIEIEGWPGELLPSQVTRRAAFAKTWDDNAAAFSCSDEMLNRIWELCRYSIKATTFAGVYVDGDRERIPYEADAYLNQLSQYYTDHDKQMARDTFDWLMKHPTWPSEWSPHMVFMAHADWLHTGDTQWLAARYESLKSKLLMDRVGADGLVRSEERHVKREDIVDWPVKERDGYVFTPVNTVVNAFHLRALTLMAELAKAVNKNAEAADYTARERKTRAVFQEKLFDAARGVYRDGEGTDHASQHASLFPLAFGIVPKEHRARVAAWVGERGMTCSVYASQYLIEGLFENDADAAAFALITAPTDRSWRHMVESGTTITWEAWDQKYKPNQDWNHAWGAAPANLLPRYVLGVQPLAPGWEQALVKPHLGTLTFASGRIPTPRGAILVDWKRGESFTLALTLPKGMTARVELPVLDGSRQVFADGKPTDARLANGRWILARDVTGRVSFEVK